LNLAAEQVGQLAADRQAKTGAAVFAVGAGVGLLEASKIIRCFSGRIPIPVSDTSKATTSAASLSTGCSVLQPALAR